MTTIHGTIPTKAVHMDVNDEDLKTATIKFMTEHPDARITRVDADFVKGIAFCGLPIMERQNGLGYDPEAQRYDCDCSECKKLKPAGVTAR